MKQKIQFNHFKLISLFSFGIFSLVASVFLFSATHDALAATQVSTYDRANEFPGITSSEAYDNFTDTFDNVTNTHSGTINFAFTYGTQSTCGIYGWMRLRSFTLYDTADNIIYTRELNPTFNATTNLKTASWSNIPGGELGRVEVVLYLNNNYPGGFTGPFPGSYICNAGGFSQITKNRVPNKNPSVITPGPSTVVVYGTSQLAIYDRPTVGLEVNGSSSITINAGQTTTLYWSTSAANAGNSCTASNTASDSSWNGLKSSDGGNQVIGPISTAGTYTYNISCTGALSSVSPTASVTVNVQAVTPPSFSINCSPPTATILAGSSTSYIITINGQNGFNNEVSLSSAISGPIGGRGQTEPVISFSPNPSLPGNVTALITTNASTTPHGTYMITITASSSGLPNQTCLVQLSISNITPPNPPVNVVASNTAQCGTIDITWGNSTGSPVPNTYRVYRRESTLNPWQQVSSDIPYVFGGPMHSYSFTDQTPLNSVGSNYYAVAGVYSGIESNYATANPYPIVPLACAPNISTSDKDVVSVAGRITMNFVTVPCSGTSEVAALPNNALFTVGDLITFRICVSNTGNQVMTGLQVSDTFTNLSNVSYVSDNPPGCVTSNSSGKDDIGFTLANLAANGGTCSITMTGVVTAPDNPSASVYRFQNRGVITADGGISRNVFTPLYLFSVSSSAPNRGETAP